LSIFIIVKFIKIKLLTCAHAPVIIVMFIFSYYLNLIAGEAGPK
jgi:hypothetical protein